MKTVSVLIPTLGRKDELIQTVTALSSQTHIPDEIIVVDQNNPPFPEVDQVLGGISNVRHLRSPVKGLVPNYNFALQAARGEIVLYLDDDVIPDEKLIEEHLAVYARAESQNFPLGGVAGRIEGPKEPSPRGEKVGFYSPLTGSVVANFAADVTSLALNEGSFLFSMIQFGPGANVSYRREPFLQMGGFDPGFDGNGYFFESDAGLRVLKAGYRMVFHPKATLIHLAAPSGGARIKDKSIHTYYFVKNGIRLYRKHSPAWGRPFFAVKMIGYVSAKALYNLDFRILWRGLQAVWDGYRRPLG